MARIDGRARAAVRTLTSYRPGTPIEDVKRRLGLRSVIKLASNENALGPSPKAVAALRHVTSSLHRYPDATCRVLRQALARHVRVRPEAVTVGNGSDELLVLALRAFIEPGDEVLVARPTFLIYELQAKACGARVRVVPLRGLRYDLPAMRRAVTSRTKLVFIANPDNPTGTYVTREELAAFLRGLPRRVITVVDEAYYEFVEARDYPQTIRWISRYPLLVTRSFSKAYGLAGLRIGYGLARPSLIRALDAVREPFNVNSMAQAAATAALTDRAFVQRTRAMLRTGRHYLLRELAALKLPVVPSVANFLLVRVGPRAARLARRLLEQGVIVREMTAWKLAGYLRVTIGTMPENRRFMHALHRTLREATR
jgi:histidinol-phosphate aminotransferase